MNATTLVSVPCRAWVGALSRSTRGESRSWDCRRVVAAHADTPSKVVIVWCRRGAGERGQYLAHCGGLLLSSVRASKLSLKHTSREEQRYHTGRSDYLLDGIEVDSVARSLDLSVSPSHTVQPSIITDVANVSTWSHAVR